MSLKTKVGIIVTVFLILACLIIPLFRLFAQEETTATASEEVSEQEVQAEIDKEENVTPQDLEIKEPGLLPDSPFYFVKNWWRGLRLAFTFDPVKDAQLREKFANEKLLELRKLAEKKKDPEIIEKARKNYERELEALKSAADKLQEVKDKQKVESFLDKFIRHQILHQKILEKLEEQVPPQAFERIKEARERHLERFKEVMLKLEDKDKLPERLEKAIEKMKGSEFKEIKALEILKRIEERVQEQNAKEVIQRARERILNRITQRVEQMTEERRRTFEKFIETLPGDKEKQLEILEDLKERLKDNPQIEEHLKKTRERIIKKIIQRKEERLKEMKCPEIVPPKEGFCEKGRVIIKRDENDCPQFVCVNPPQVEQELRERIRKELSEEKQAACIEVWDPVCGKDGKTYSNACFAKIAGVEIAHQGICEESIREKLPPLMPYKLQKGMPK